MNGKIIYHMCKECEWLDFKHRGFYEGSSQDKRDGFIHFSTADQIVESARKHRGGQDNLVLLSVNSNDVQSILKWEKVDGGRVFPHIYGTLLLKNIFQSDILRLSSNGKHIFPDQLS